MIVYMISCYSWYYLWPLFIDDAYNKASRSDSDEEPKIQDKKGSSDEVVIILCFMLDQG